MAHFDRIFLKGEGVFSKALLKVRQDLIHGGTQYICIFQGFFVTTTTKTQLVLKKFLVAPEERRIPIVPTILSDHRMTTKQAKYLIVKACLIQKYTEVIHITTQEVKKNLNFPSHLF